MQNPTYDELVIKVTELENAAREMRDYEYRYSTLIETMQTGYALHEIVLDENNCPVDYIFLEVNREFEILTGLKKENILGKRVTEVLPGIINDSTDWIKIYGEVALSGNEIKLEQYSELFGEWFSVTARGLLNGRFLTLIDNTTESKKTEHTLNFTKFALDRIGDAAYWMSADARFIYVNEASCRALGYTREELLSMTVHDIGPEFPVDIWLEHWEDLRKRKTFSFETTHLTKDGRQVPVEINVNYVKFGDEEYNCAFARDISRRKKIEKALADEQRKLDYILRGTNAGTWDWNVQTGELDLGEKWAEFIGYTLEELKPISVDTWLETTHPEDLARAQEMLEKIFKRELDNYDVEFRQKHKNGSWVWINARGKVAEWDGDGKPLRMSGTHNDITHRKKVEEDIARMGYILENSLNEIYLFHCDTYTFLQVNKGARDNLGYSIDELQELTPMDIKPEYTRDSFNTLVQPLRTGDQQNIRFNANHRRKDGTSYPVDVNIQLISLGESSIFCAIVNDTTERMQAEKELVEIEKRYQGLVEVSSDWVWEVDIDGRYTYCSPKVKEILGYEPEEIIGKRPFDIMPEDHSEKVETEFNEVMRKAEPIVRLENRNYRKDGTIAVLETSGVPFFNADGKLLGYRGVDRDITGRIRYEVERSKLEQQLFESQKMESIGRLAGGIAHDFNNTLTGIMGYAELLKMKFTDPATVEGEAAKVIVEGTERAAHLTKQLLGFARGGKYNPVPLNINNIIRDTVKLAEKGFPNIVEIVYNFVEDPKLIDADKNQMEQVLTNLIINACDFMPDGGKLIFETDNVILDKGSDVKEHGLKNGNYVKFSVIDTGAGIPSEYQEKVFEPFFTTKNVGEGIGLGLANVYGIVKNHGGIIELFSEKGEGTRFTIYMPVSKREKPSTLSNEKEPVSGKGKTVLVIDDEEYVRNISQLQLNELGYKVLLTSSGEEAVNIYKQKYNMVDIILLDVIMPEMDGFETYKKLRRIHSEVKVLVMSGFSKEGKASDILNHGAHGFIQKPFKLGDLSAVLANILEPQQIL